MNPMHTLCTLTAAFSILFLSTSTPVAADKAACPLYPIQKYTQKLVHNNFNCTDTFEQSYQLDLSHFRPGGPILFLQGAENAELFCMEYGYFSDIAKELGAALAGLEHRFFGESVPEGVDPTSPTSDFSQLTMENILMDSVRFIEWVKNSHKNTTELQDAKVIVTSGTFLLWKVSIDCLLARY
jgi:hypothetical protein